MSLQRKLGCQSRHYNDGIQLGNFLLGCEIIVANQESLSPQQELVEDLMAIIHCFSGRLYGLRNYSKEIKETLKKAIDEPKQDLTELDNKEIQC